MHTGEAKALQITRASSQTSNDPHELALRGRSSHRRQAAPFRVPARSGGGSGYFSFCTEAGRARLSPGEAGGRRPATPARGLSPPPPSRPQRADLVTGRAARVLPARPLAAGARGDARPGRTLGRPRPSPPSAAAAPRPSLPDRPRPRRRSLLGPTRGAAAAATASGALTILSPGFVPSPPTPPPSSSGCAVDPPTSPATNKTRSSREGLCYGGP